MKRIHPLELAVGGTAFLMSWGLYLAICLLMLQKPLQQQLEEQIRFLFANHPHVLIGIVTGYIVLRTGSHIWYRSLAEANRRRDYQQWAKQHQWDYHPEEDKQLYFDLGFLCGIPGYEGLSFSSRKRFPCAIHTFEKTWPHYQAIAYTNYSRTTRQIGSGETKRTITVESFLSVTLIRVEHRFPKLYIRPLHGSDGLAKLLRSPHSKTLVPFKTTNPKFNSHYKVFTTDSIFAKQCLHSGMLAYLSDKKLQVEINQDVLVLYRKGRLEPEQIEENLAHLLKLYQLIPMQWRR